jgi:hypothetical protein
MSNLKIKVKNQTQEFEILEDAVAVNLNTDQHKLSYKIPFEEIRDSTYTIRNKGDKKVGLLYLSSFFNIVLILFIFSDELKFDLLYVYAAIFPLTLLLTLAFNEINKGFEEKHIESDKILYFISTKKNESEIDNFIASIFENRNSFIKAKYLKIDPIIPYHIQNERILRLYTNKHITESEYELIKEDLDRYFNFNPTI